MNPVIGIDAAWGGMGWCLATEQGPVAVGHVKLGDRKRRYRALHTYLLDAIEPQIRAGFALGNTVELVLEEPPTVYRGASRGDGQAGNQAATGFGMGRLVGAIEFWWSTAAVLGYPVTVTPTTWRRWWKLGGRGREERKQRAVEVVTANGWGDRLTPYPWRPKTGGPRGDVAESILIAVGAARRPDGEVFAAPKTSSTRKRSS